MQTRIQPNPEENSPALSPGVPSISVSEIGMSPENPATIREDQLRAIIDTIPVLAWSAHPDGSADFFNQRWLDYSGLSVDEARGWGWMVAVHADDLTRLTDCCKSVVAAGEPGEIEARLRRADGEYRWFLFRANPFRDESGTSSSGMEQTQISKIVNGPRMRFA